MKHTLLSSSIAVLLTTTASYATYCPEASQVTFIKSVDNPSVGQYRAPGGWSTSGTPLRKSDVKSFLNTILEPNNPSKPKTTTYYVKCDYQLSAPSFLQITLLNNKFKRVSSPPVGSPNWSIPPASMPGENPIYYLCTSLTNEAKDCEFNTRVTQASYCPEISQISFNANTEQYTAAGGWTTSSSPSQKADVIAFLGVAMKPNTVSFPIPNSKVGYYVQCAYQLSSSTTIALSSAQFNQAYPIGANWSKPQQADALPSCASSRPSNCKFNSI